MTEVRIPSGGKIPPLFKPIDIFEIGNPGMPAELIIHNGKLYVYSNTGITLIEGGIIQTAAILANSITANKLKFGSQKFTHNIIWTATDSDTCSWEAGTIKFSDESTQNINAGNTGNISNTTYIYYDGTSTLKTTTTYSSAIGDEKILLAMVEEGNDDGKCIITPIYSTGTTIDGNKIVTGKIQSSDGKTYFDLDNKYIIMNDGINDRLLIGYQLGGF